MHFPIASLTCCALLFIQGYAEKEKGFQCKQNVPDKAEKALLDAINEQRTELGIPKLKENAYDCDLAKRASARNIGGSVFPLKGERTFEKDWSETLKKALKTSRQYEGSCFSDNDFIYDLGRLIADKHFPNIGSAFQKRTYIHICSYLAVQITKGAKKIGCKITLTTSPDDGSHKAKLYCLLEMENLPVYSEADAADAAKM
ncbi:hypothetical protein V3C99_003735 [Haemonchus contortus]